jgi:hypothetical protein
MNNLVARVSCPVLSCLCLMPGVGNLVHVPKHTIICPWLISFVMLTSTSQFSLQVSWFAVSSLTSTTQFNSTPSELFKELCAILSACLPTHHGPATSTEKTAGYLSERGRRVHDS